MFDVRDVSDEQEATSRASTVTTMSITAATTQRQRQRPERGHNNQHPSRAGSGSQ